MADSWEDYEEEAAPIATAQGAYEDDDVADDVLDSWDMDDDDDGGDDKKVAAAAPKKKKSLNQIIEERKQAEEKKQAELAAKKAQEEKELHEDPAERKKRLAQLERDADMENTVDLFSGVSDSTGNGLSTAAPAAVPAQPVAYSIDKAAPKTKQEFEQLATELVKRIHSFKAKSSILMPFYEKLFKEAVDNLDYTDIRKLSSALSTLSNDKQRQEKERKSGKKTTKKAQVTVGADDLDGSSYNNNSYDDYDDFM